MAATLERQIGRMCIVGFEGHTAPAYLLDWLRAGRVGGIILFARNIISPAQVHDLTESLRAACPDDLLIAIDQEGGAVARLRASNGFTEVPGAMALAATPKGERHTENVYEVLGAELRAVGIDWDYAPCLDLAYNADNPSLGTRSFGLDPSRVGQLAGAAVRGLQAAPHQVAACGKHFPGLGDTAIDTHLALPIIYTPLEQLMAVDLQPYKSIVEAGVASVMVTHTIFASLDADLPATLSPVVVRHLLRDALGYDGVACTDCMEMKAIADHISAGESAVLAALAGIDAILFSHTPKMQAEVYDALLAAARSGRLPASIIADANRRLAALRTFAVHPPFSLEPVYSERHRTTALNAARAALAVVPAKASVRVPGASHGDATEPFDTSSDLMAATRVGVIEFPSHLDSGVSETAGLTGFAAEAKARMPEARVIIWRQGDPAVHTLAATCSPLVIAVRSAHLSPTQAAAARALIAAAPGEVIIVALRNPYDVALFGGEPKVRAVLCTFGDGAPSLAAAADALAGDFHPSGAVPVPLGAPM